MAPDRPRLRVAYVTDTMAATQMLSGLAERFDLTLVVPASLGEDATNFWPPPDDVAIERVDVPGGRPAFVPRVARWLRRRRTDFDAVMTLDSLTAALGANLGRLAGGPPVVLQVGRPTLEYIRCRRGEQATLPLRLRHAVARALIAVNERRAAGVGAVSDYVASGCSDRNRNVHSIGWFGVDTDLFAPSWSREEARRRLGLPVEGHLVMWRSRAAPEKDPDTFLRAVRSLRDEGLDLTAVFMGGEIEEMRERARRAGVDLVAGQAGTTEEIPLWYVAADVNVQTSKSEGLGVSVLESIACGTPVVVSDVGGLPETVGGGQHGTLVPRGDDQALAAAIRKALEAPPETEHLEAGRTFVARTYGRDVVFDAWEHLVRSVACLPSPERSPAR